MNVRIENKIMMFSLSPPKQVVWVDDEVLAINVTGMWGCWCGLLVFCFVSLWLLFFFAHFSPLKVVKAIRNSYITSTAHPQILCGDQKKDPLTTKGERAGEWFSTIGLVTESVYAIPHSRGA